MVEGVVRFLSYLVDIPSADPDERRRSRLLNLLLLSLTVLTFLTLLVTILVSLVTRPRPDAELRGLVYSLTERPRDEGLRWHQRPAVLAVAVLGMTLILNVVFF